MQSSTRCPRTAPTIASATPVLPLVASRIVAVAAGFGRARPAVEDDPEELWSLLLGELPRLLERAACGRRARLHPQLTGEQQHPDLRVGLLDPSRELQDLLRLLERRVGVGPREQLGLRGADRRERRIATHPFGDPGRTRQAFAGARRVAVLDVERGGVGERACDLVQEPELFVDEQALLA